RMVSLSRFLFEHRTTDAIKPKGITVFPCDVESVLRRIEGVQNAIVVGVRHERKGEMLAAAIVCQNNSRKPTVREILAVCKKELPALSIPQIFQFLDELPVDEAGKISRRILGELITARIRQRSHQL